MPATIAEVAVSVATSGAIVANEMPQQTRIGGMHATDRGDCSADTDEYAGMRGKCFAKPASFAFAVAVADQLRNVVLRVRP